MLSFSITLVTALIESGSTIFPENYFDLQEDQQIQILSKVQGKVDLSLIKDEETLKGLTYNEGNKNHSINKWAGRCKQIYHKQ